MSLSHLRNVFYLLTHEGVRSALSYDVGEFAKKYAEVRYQAYLGIDAKYLNSLENGKAYIFNSRRPQSFKDFAVELITELTHDNQLYFTEKGGLRELIDAALVGRLKRKENTVYRIRVIKGE
jgi:hypothetical protein